MTVLTGQKMFIMNYAKKYISTPISKAKLDQKEKKRKCIRCILCLNKVRVIERWTNGLEREDG